MKEKRNESGFRNSSHNKKDSEEHTLSASGPSVEMECLDTVRRSGNRGELSLKSTDVQRWKERNKRWKKTKT